jgi:hypothetical protein
MEAASHFTLYWYCQNKTTTSIWRIQIKYTYPWPRPCYNNDVRIQRLHINIW